MFYGWVGWVSLGGFVFKWVCGVVNFVGVAIDFMVVGLRCRVDLWLFGCWGIV